MGSSRVSHRNTEIVPASSASSAPSRTGMLNRPMLSVLISPTVNVRSLLRLRAGSVGAEVQRLGCGQHPSPGFLPQLTPAVEGLGCGTDGNAGQRRDVPDRGRPGSRLGYQSPPFSVDRSRLWDLPV